MIKFGYKWLWLIAVSVILSTPVLADWNCGGTTYNDCPSTYPQSSCINNVANCLMINQDPNQYCIINDAGTTWSDYWFCTTGNKAICNVQTTYQHNMVCCPNDFPVWNEQYQQCWKQGWDCTADTQCTSPKKCVGNTCQCVANWVCDAWSSCVNGQQVRTCNDGCGNSKADKQTCTPDHVCPTVVIPCSTNTLTSCNSGNCPSGYVAGTSDSCGYHSCDVVTPPPKPPTTRPDLIDWITIIVAIIILAIIWVI